MHPSLLNASILTLHLFLFAQINAQIEWEVENLQDYYIYTDINSNQGQQVPVFHQTNSNLEPKATESTILSEVIPPSKTDVSSTHKVTTSTAVTSIKNTLASASTETSTEAESVMPSGSSHMQSDEATSAELHHGIEGLIDSHQIPVPSSHEHHNGIHEAPIPVSEPLDSVAADATALRPSGMGMAMKVCVIVAFMLLGLCR